MGWGGYKSLLADEKRGWCPGGDGEGRRVLLQREIAEELEGVEEFREVGGWRAGDDSDEGVA